LNKYRVYMDLYDELDTEANSPLEALEHFRMVLQLLTPDEFINLSTFTVDDLTNNCRTEINS